MSKFLVNLNDGKISSTHDFPMDFSISGHYVIDVPTALQIKAQTDSIVDLETAKVAAFSGLHQSLPIKFNDELITNPNIDKLKSSRYAIGPDKRSVIFPSGQIVTNLLVVPTATTSIFAHWHGFTLSIDNNQTSNIKYPDRVLYNYNSAVSAFQKFSSSTFTVDIMDSTNTTVLATLTPDVEQSFIFASGSIRLRFTNNDLSKHYHLSDWILLLG